MQKFVNVRTTAESVKPLEIDDYHVYVNTGIKEIHEEAKEGDLSSGFDGFEIETQRKKSDQRLLRSLRVG